MYGSIIKLRLRLEVGVDHLADCSSSIYMIRASNEGDECSIHQGTSVVEPDDHCG